MYPALALLAFASCAHIPGGSAELACVSCYLAGIVTVKLLGRRRVENRPFRAKTGGIGAVCMKGAQPSGGRWRRKD